MTNRVAFENLKILLADDNPGMANTMGAFMRVMGVEQFENCTNGERALERFSDQSWNLVITDYNMAPMDGLTLMENIRHRRFGQAARIPAIMITGYTDTNRIVAAQKLGISQILRKPFGIQEIQDRIEWCMKNPITFVLDGDRYIPADAKARRVQNIA